MLEERKKKKEKESESTNNLTTKEAQILEQAWWHVIVM